MFSPYTFVLVVMEMKRISPHRKFSLRAKVLRLLRMNRGFEEISNNREGNIHFAIPISNNHNYQKEIETGLLEAERKKAEALMESQRHHFIC
jgi:hypothetical protein